MLHATQDEIVCVLFASEVALYKANMSVFLDETGTDRRDKVWVWLERKTNWCNIAHKLLVRGQHLSTIAFMSTRRFTHRSMVYCMIVLLWLMELMVMCSMNLFTASCCVI